MFGLRFCDFGLMFPACGFVLIVLLFSDSYLFGFSCLLGNLDCYYLHAGFACY